MISSRLISTTATRIIVLGGSLATVLLNTEYLGVKGLGTASLISTGILILVAMSNFISGGALVYLTPRNQSGFSFIPSLIWTALCALLFYMAFGRIWRIFPEEYLAHIIALGVLQSFFMMLQYTSMGNNKLNAYNITTIIQSVFTALGIWFFYVLHQEASIERFIDTLYISFSLTLTAAILFNRQALRGLSFSGIISTSREIFKYGKFAQTGNILHLLNQRSMILYLEKFAVLQRHSVGIFSLSLYIAEAIWTVSKSIALIQYASISNSDNHQTQRQSSIASIKVSLVVVLSCSVVAVILPESMYTWVFKSDVTELKATLLALTPGMLANAVSIVLASYFSGIGSHKTNAIASAIGIVPVLAMGPMVQWWSSPGASAITSLAFVLQCIYMIVIFRKKKESA